MSKLKIFIKYNTIFIGIGVALLACGKKSSHNDQSDTAYKSRFTDAELPALEGGSVQVLTFGKGGKDTPNDVQRFNLGDNTVGTEVKMYLPFTTTLGTFKTKLITTMQNVSDYKSMTDEKGSAIFKSTASVDVTGKDVPSKIDGKVPSEGEFHFVKIESPQPVGPVDGILSLNLTEDKDTLRLALVNDTPLKTKIAGIDKTIADKGNYVIKMEFFPYKKGYLVFSVGKIKASDIFDSSLLNPEYISKPQLAMINYFHKKAQE